jgi:hypothetical protein
MQVPGHKQLSGNILPDVRRSHLSLRFPRYNYHFENYGLYERFVGVECRKTAGIRGQAQV